MTFFISPQPSNVNFQIRRARVPNLAIAQTLAIQVEYDLLSSGKWSCDLQKGKGQQASITTTNPLYQKFANYGNDIQLEDMFIFIIHINERQK